MQERCGDAANAIAISLQSQPIPNPRCCTGACSKLSLCS
jgi:hypothetical protein